ncbi:D-amino-acid transaminase [Allobacillus halotolerans]|uniref:D-alanine aminotransferase n=1 Tax=Allobacillus halotolerans TaxID=570278 RepID=A0ABS6GSB4_9BACI|nr:D-amino-acid transaminase [Allobacillus halotolerans]MBU6081791.1 D-amino-acid transaminase [Allobacillus halotolerans]
MIILKNDTFIERKDALIDMEDRGFQFGDGVYEVIRIYNGKFFLLEDHLKRLQYSLNEAQIDVDLAKRGIKEKLIELAEKNSVDDGGLYIQISRGVAPRNHLFPADAEATIFAYPLPLKKPTDQQKNGVKAILDQDIRWLRCDIKSLNLMGNILAKQKAKDSGAYEAILYRDENHVTEGSSTNIFIVKDGKLITHPKNNYILHGITRKYIQFLAEKLEIEFVERVYSVKEVLEADEVFLTSTTSEVTPIVEIDNEKVNDGQPGPITKKLLEQYDQYLHVERLD